MNRSKRVQRSCMGQSAVIMLILCVLSGLWLAGLFSALLPSYQRIATVKQTNMLRTTAESSLDWAVDQLSSAAASTIDVAYVGGNPSGPNPRVTNLTTNSFVPAGVQVSVSVQGINCPANAPCYQAALDNSVPANGLTNGPLWRIVSATASSAGKTRSIEAILAPSLTPSNPWQYAMASFNEITVQDGGVSGSWNSNSGSPSGANLNTQNGDLAANGNISLGSMNVGGNVITKQNGSITGNGATVQRTVTAAGSTNAQLSPGGSSTIAVVNAGNAASPIRSNVGGTPVTAVSIPPHAGAAALPNSGNISAGNYTVNTLDQQTLNVTSGPVNIFVEGPSASIQWTGNITVASGHPADLRIWYSGNQDVHLDNGNQFMGVLYAPNSPMVHFDDGGTLYGSVVGAHITLDDGSKFYYDQALSSLALGGGGVKYQTASYREF